MKDNLFTVAFIGAMLLVGAVGGYVATVMTVKWAHANEQMLFDSKALGDNCAKYTTGRNWSLAIGTTTGTFKCLSADKPAETVGGSTQINP